MYSNEYKQAYNISSVVPEVSLYGLVLKKVKFHTKTTNQCGKQKLEQFEPTSISQCIRKTE